MVALLRPAALPKGPLKIGIARLIEDDLNWRAFEIILTDGLLPVD